MNKYCINELYGGMIVNDEYEFIYCCCMMMDSWIYEIDICHDSLRVDSLPFYVAMMRV